MNDKPESAVDPRVGAETLLRVQFEHAVAQRDALREALIRLHNAADAICERADYGLVDSGQWARLGPATDNAAMVLCDTIRADGKPSADWYRHASPSPPKDARLYAETPWLLTFADVDRQICCYENEAEAVEAFNQAKQQWTCTLYRAVGISGAGPEKMLDPPVPKRCRKCGGALVPASPWIYGDCACAPEDAKTDTGEADLLRELAAKLDDGYPRGKSSLVMVRADLLTRCRASIESLAAIAGRLPAPLQEGVGRGGEGPTDGDLLAAAKRSLNWLASYPGRGADGCYDQMRAAIAKTEAAPKPPEDAAALVREIDRHFHETIPGVPVAHRVSEADRLLLGCRTIIAEANGAQFEEIESLKAANASLRDKLAEARWGALEEAAKLCERTTPDRAAVKVIGEAVHYAACAAAIRDLADGRKAHE